MRIKGLFFDMDGTIVHTYNMWDDVLAGIVGADNISKFRAARKIYPGRSIGQYKIILSEEFGRSYTEPEVLQLFRDSCERVFMPADIKFVDGFKEFIEHINRRRLSSPIVKALVTNAPSYSLDILRTKLNLKHYFFSNIVNSDMANAFKPDPAIIKYALNKFGLEPQYTLMFEDSDDGVAACNAAKVRCVGIRGAIKDESKCDMMIDNYVGLTMETLRDIE